MTLRAFPALRSARARGARLASVALAAACFAGVAGCNEERKQECDKFLSAMAPLKEGTPNADAVDRVSAQVSAIGFQDQPLREYAKNYRQTLSVLSATLKLKEGAASPDAVPDGTEGVIKKNLTEARTDDADIARYCAP